MTKKISELREHIEVNLGSYPVIGGLVTEADAVVTKVNPAEEGKSRLTTNAEFFYDIKVVNGSDIGAAVLQYLMENPGLVMNKTIEGIRDTEIPSFVLE